MKEYSDLLDSVIKQAEEDRKANDWKYKNEKNGVKIYSKHIEGSPYLLTKSEYFIQNFSDATELMHRLLKREVTDKNWEPSRKELEFLEKYDDSNYFCLIRKVYALGAFIQNREFIIARKTVSVEKGIIEAGVSVEREDIEIKEKNIRGQTKFVLWFEEDSDKNHVKITMMTHADPKGLIPAWVVNAFGDAELARIAQYKLLVE